MTTNNNQTSSGGVGGSMPIQFSFSFGASSTASISGNTGSASKDNFLAPTAPIRKASIFQEHSLPDQTEAPKESVPVRTGYANVTKSSEQIGRNTSSMAVKQHKKHQVVDQYFASKLEELEREEREKEMLKNVFDQDQIVNRVLQALSQSKEQEQQQLENYLIKCQELDNLQHMSNQTRKKLKVCYTCQQLFAGSEHLKRHERESEEHKEKVERLKLAQDVLMF